MALQYNPCGPNNLGCIDPDEIQDYALSFEQYPGGLILQTIEWLVNGPFVVDPSTPTSPQGVTVIDDYTAETWLKCERVRLRCDLTDAEKLASIGSVQKVTLRFTASDGRSWDRSFTLDVQSK